MIRKSVRVLGSASYNLYPTYLVFLMSITRINLVIIVAGVSYAIKRSPEISLKIVKNVTGLFVGVFTGSF